MHSLRAAVQSDRASAIDMQIMINLTNKIIIKEKCNVYLKIFSSRKQASWGKFDQNWLQNKKAVEV